MKHKDCCFAGSWTFAPCDHGRIVIMGRDGWSRTDKNIFLVVSADKNRIHKITNTLMSQVQACSVFHASDWFDTKYKMDNVKPKILLIDEYLQKGSGAEIVAKILRDSNNNAIQIVIMSAVADQDLFGFEAEKNRIRYLTEPEDELALMTVINSILKPVDRPSGPEYVLRHMVAGEILFKEGEAPEVVYIVKNGRLRARTQKEPGGELVILGEIKAGEFVGEMGHFNHEPRSATVEAITDVVLIEIPIHSLESVIFAKPSWAKALVKTLALRLKKANSALKMTEAAG